MDNFTHFTKDGQSRMVDVSTKPTTTRRAVAGALLRMSSATLERFHQLQLPKGNPFEVARVAGIMAAKQTSQLIPLCHPLLLTFVDVQIEPGATGIEITAEVRCQGNTGVEMEALLAAAVAGLTLYDMGKAVDKSMVLEGVRLLEKEGGKSGFFKADDQ